MACDMAVRHSFLFCNSTAAQDQVACAACNLPNPVVKQKDVENGRNPTGSASTDSCARALDFSESTGTVALPRSLFQILSKSELSGARDAPKTNAFRLSH